MISAEELYCYVIFVDSDFGFCTAVAFILELWTWSRCTVGGRLDFFSKVETRISVLCRCMKTIGDRHSSLNAYPFSFAGGGTCFLHFACMARRPDGCAV